MLTKYHLSIHKTSMRYITVNMTARNSGHLSEVNLGTGNVLFEIASTYGIAKKYDLIAEFSTVHEYCDYIADKFGVNHKETLYRNCKSIHVGYEWNIQDSSCEKKYDSGLISFVERNPYNVKLFSHLEFPGYFTPYRDDILNLFSPDEKSQSIIDMKYPELKTHTCISLHVRLGNDANTKCKYNYYQLAIQYINERVSNPFYYIFSDGVVDISQLQLSSPYTIVNSNPDYIDLWTMSQCKHNIINYSTFSWWGAYLNKNETKYVLFPRSTVKYIQTQNGESEDAIRRDYFLNNIQIEDTK
jgi:hypothetical protein